MCHFKTSVVGDYSSFAENFLMNEGCIGNCRSVHCGLLLFTVADLTSFLVVMLAAQEEFKHIEVEYIEMPGWNCSTEKVRKFADLPQAAQDYVHKIEELVDVPS